VPNPSASALAERVRAAADASWNAPEARIQRALDRLSRVPRLPGAGSHSGPCHGHVDCLAIALEHILGGGNQ
jgi:hypothetical protein